MPAYITGVFKPSPQLLTAGLPTYLFGSFDDRSSPTFGQIISNSAATTTGTVTFNVVSGNVPIVGDNITVRGAARSVNFNTTATVLTVVAQADATGIQTGVVTVTYAISSTTLGTASDVGEVECSHVEVGETLAAQASVPAAVPFNVASPDNGRVLSAFVSFPTAPTAVTVVLQGADFDKDSEYVTIGTIVSATNTAGSFTTGQGAAGTLAAANKVNFRFYRFLASGLTGSGTIVAKLMM